MRQVYFSFEYKKDAWRASQIRNMNVVSNDSTFSDNDWEEVKSKDEKAIEKWIKDQMEMRSCIVVLIGESTASRKWVKYEIEQAYKMNKGMVGIYINKLEDQNGNQSDRGSNPFDYVYADDGTKLSNYIECFESAFQTSKFVYDDIKQNIEDLIEHAIENKAPRR